MLLVCTQFEVRSGWEILPSTSFILWDTSWWVGGIKLCHSVAVSLVYLNHPGKGDNDSDSTVRKYVLCTTCQNKELDKMLVKHLTD